MFSRGAVGPVAPATQCRSRNRQTKAIGTTFHINQIGMFGILNLLLLPLSFGNSVVVEPVQQAAEASALPAGSAPSVDAFHTRLALIEARTDNETTQPLAKRKRKCCGGEGKLGQPLQKQRRV
jgi:hypothetical protein